MLDGGESTIQFTGLVHFRRFSSSRPLYSGLAAIQYLYNDIVYLSPSPAEHISVFDVCFLHDLSHMQVITIS